MYDEYTIRFIIFMLMIAMVIRGFQKMSGWVGDDAKKKAGGMFANWLLGRIFKK